MNNIKKIIATYAFALIALMFIGNHHVYASEVTGTISSSTGSSGSQSVGTVSGTVGGGSTISGTVGGGSGGGGGGNNISGSVSNGGGGGGGGLPVIGNQSNSGGGRVLGASTVSDIPGLPNTGIGSVNPTLTLLSSSMVLLGLLLGVVGYGIFTSNLGKGK